MFLACCGKTDRPCPEEVEVVVPKAQHGFAHRLEKEFDRLQQSLPMDVKRIERLACEDCVEAWRAVIVGPANTPYAGGMYEMDICFPENYPYEQPALRFNTPIYHVNVDLVTGEICCSDFQWAPASKISHLLEVITAMLHVPDATPTLGEDDFKKLNLPPEKEIIRLFHMDRDTYDLAAQQWTEKYAS
mmetsp:Transcript_30394/g.69970  ORF Transcript_30394/g.69970 Transcript_30394/m.69970 type:complete len:188 (+) Transcript_30394:80-643(+)